MPPKSNTRNKRSGSPKEDEVTCKKSVAINIIPSSVLEEEEDKYVNKLKDAWISKKDFADSKVKIFSTPFLHGECTTFVENEAFLDEFVENFESFQFQEKASDLFQFRQSDDLKSYVNPHVYKITEYLTQKVCPWLKTVTQLPLNGNIDLFLSDYRKNDFLLCHDDELDSRRIAFILYLSKDWKPEYGGNLDLFSATENVHPKEVVKSISPEFNKFVFFEVSETSFHQVSEVTEDGVKRLALSGWFYGDPLPRAKINYPNDEGYLCQKYSITNENVLHDFCSDSYLVHQTQQDINEQITEESQCLIPGFLQDSVYKEICADIVDQDVTLSRFVTVGPPNVANYQETCRGPPSLGETSEGTSIIVQKNLEGLQLLFHSNEFLQFMEKITELPFTSSPVLKATSALRKYTKGSYYLLKSGGAKQTGESMTEHENDKDDDENEDPNLVDVVFFIASKWNESWGGLTIYSTEDGEQLITIPPEGNCLAIVVRNSSVNSYVNYINCNAGDEVYFTYTMTYALDGHL